METRLLRDIKVSEVGMGCTTFSHGYGQVYGGRADLPWCKGRKRAGGYRQQGGTGRK